MWFQRTQCPKKCLVKASFTCTSHLVNVEFIVFWSIGEIIGIVIGVLAIKFILFWLCWKCWYRKQTYTEPSLHIVAPRADTGATSSMPPLGYSMRPPTGTIDQPALGYSMIPPSDNMSQIPLGYPAIPPTTT